VVSEIGERRPIAARSWRWSGAAAAWLARRGATANGISLAGLGCGVAAGLVLPLTAALPGGARVAWLAAAVLVVARLAANMFDGMVAVATGTSSRLGELYNEIPDRVSDTAVLVGFGYAAGGSAVLGFAAALAAMLTAYVRAVGRGLGRSQEFCGPMAKQQRMAVIIAVCCWGAAIDPGQALLSSATGGLGLVVSAELVIIVGGLVTATRRLRRIAAAL